MTEIKDFVFETFLRLTSKTVPYGHEDRFIRQVGKIFPELKQDIHGNYFYKIGESRTVFASHLDTVSKEYTSVTHVIDGDIIRTDGNTTLGADDKAGVTVMLWMIQNNIPGLYYFFIGEEVGCIGSGFASRDNDFKNYDRIISFDRRGTNSVITYQSCGRCCSDEFADSLCDELNMFGLNYTKDMGGIYTDSAEFTDIIPECTNISVGYYKEHTTTEHQDIKHLVELAGACIKVDWESLPTKRDPKSPYSSNFRTYDLVDDWSDDDGDNIYELYDDGNLGYPYKSKKKKTRRGNRRKSKTYYDSGNGLIEISTNDDFDFDDYNLETGGDKYSWVMDKFIDGNLTIDELEIIKEQYLDINIKYDKFFYNYLLGQITA